MTKPCNEFKGLRSNKGYGIVYVNGKQVRAHRLSYLLHKGPIKRTFRVCHHCDNPPCIEPEHLFQGTGKDNALDSVRKGRWGDRRQFGENNGRAVLCQAQVEKLRMEFDGKRGCIARLARKNKLDWNTVKRAVKGLSWKNSPTRI